MTTSNKAAFKRVLDATNTHDEALLAETIDDTFHPDVAMGTPLPIQATGTQAIKEVFGMLHSAFPDLTITVEDLIEEDDKVVARNRVSGTHAGSEYMGLPATGRSITYNEIIVVRFADSRIIETWAVVDVLSQMRQLGVIQA